jgi:acyl carrier protein
MVLGLNILQPFDVSFSGSLPLKASDAHQPMGLAALKCPGRLAHRRLGRVFWHCSKLLIWLTPMMNEHPASGSRFRIMNDHETELTRLIISTLNLDFNPSDASAETPLYGEGLGLDSIDILEIALAVSQKYKVTLHSDDENNTEIFRNIGSLSEYIQENRP